MTGPLELTIDAEMVAAEGAGAEDRYAKLGLRERVCGRQV